MITINEIYDFASLNVVKDYTSIPLTLFESHRPGFKFGKYQQLKLNIPENIIVNYTFVYKVQERPFHIFFETDWVDR